MSEDIINAMPAAIVVAMPMKKDFLHDENKFSCG